jgi:hypothetical protein
MSGALAAAGLPELGLVALVHRVGQLVGQVRDRVTHGVHCSSSRFSEYSRFIIKSIVLLVNIFAVVQWHCITINVRMKLRHVH